MALRLPGYDHGVVPEYLLDQCQILRRYDPFIHALLHLVHRPLHPLGITEGWDQQWCEPTQRRIQR